MKKALLILLIALVSISTVFAQGAGESAAAEGGKHKIGVLAPAVTHGWVAGVAYYAEQRCEELAD